MPKHPSIDIVTSTRVEVVPRRGLSRNEAARYVGVSPSKFDECVRDGRMPAPFRIDARVIWDLRQLDTAFDALSGEADRNTFADWS